MTRRTPHATKVNELSLYTPLEDSIPKWWAARRPWDGHGTRYDPVVKLTANRKRLHGKWACPDFVLVVRNDFPFAVAPQIEVTTVEVKLWRDRPNIADVYEALAQRRLAHKAVLLVYATRDDIEGWGSADGSRGSTRPSSSNFRDVVEIASEHGVGLVVADNLHDTSKWTEHVRARRTEPKPLWMSRLLDMSFTDDQERRNVQDMLGAAEAPSMGRHPSGFVANVVASVVNPPSSSARRAA